jgi:hypothetical protein
MAGHGLRPGASAATWNHRPAPAPPPIALPVRAAAVASQVRRGRSHARPMKLAGSRPCEKGRDVRFCRRRRAPREEELPIVLRSRACLDILVAACEPDLRRNAGSAWAREGRRGPQRVARAAECLLPWAPLPLGRSALKGSPLHGCSSPRDAARLHASDEARGGNQLPPTTGLGHAQRMPSAFAHGPLWPAAPAAPRSCSGRRAAARGGRGFGWQPPPPPALRMTQKRSRAAAR